MRRDDRGATAVEFALVVPLFFVLIGIAGYFAWELFTQAQLDRAAQRAARYAAIPTTEGTYAFGQCDVVTNLNEHLSSMTVPSSGVEVTDRAGALPPATCPGGPAATTPRGFVRVRVRYELDNPFSDVLTFLLQRPDPLVITGSGEARVEDPT
jgi:hypothetical protein